MDIIDVIMKTGDGFLQPITIVDTSLPDRPLIYVNNAFTELTGLSPREVVGKNCRFLQGPLTDPQTVENIRRAMAKKEALSQDLINYTRDGVMMYNRLVLIPQQKGSRLFYIGLQHQITEDKYGPVLNISQSDLFDRTLNPLTIVLATAELDLPNSKKLFQKAVQQIRDFVFNL